MVKYVIQLLPNISGGSMIWIYRDHNFTHFDSFSLMQDTQLATMVHWVMLHKASCIPSFSHLFLFLFSSSTWADVTFPQAMYIPPHPPTVHFFIRAILVLAWKILWMEEPGRLQSMGSWRVGHDWATSLSLFTFMHWRRKWQPTPVFLPGESQGWGSLVGCHLWGCTESDTTEMT